jgi:hypothetical protein
MKKLWFWAKFTTIACLLSLSCHQACAQFKSAIEGTVTDSSGAVVVDAEVTLTNIDTGISRTVPTNAEGIFRFPSLGPGRYKVSCTKSGFATVEQENITLAAEEIRTIGLALKPGTASQVINVNADINPIQLSESKVGGDISGREISQLPLAGRNVGNLILQTPGVTGTGNASGNASDTDIFSLVNNPQANGSGQRGDGNAFYLDNTLATSNPDPGVFNLTPNVESVQELHVSVNDYSAEYGRSGSLVIQAVTKGGTNEFHGSLFEYHQDNALTAAYNGPIAAPPPVSRRNEFGGSLGAPILKNRLFGFFSWDQKKQSQPTSFQSVIETSEFVNYLKNNLPNNLSTELLTQFPAKVGTLVPNSVQTVQDLDPNCSAQAPLPGIACDMPIRQTVVESFAGRNDGLQWNFRVDAVFSKDRFYGSFYRKTPNTEGINARPGFANPNSFAGITNYGNLDWTHTFSANVVNDASMGITRISGLGTCVNCDVPSITGMGITDFGNGFAPAEFIQNDFEWRDLLSWNRGRHAMKFGFDIFRDQENDLFDGPTQRPGYGFSSTAALNGGIASIFNFALDEPTTQGAINYNLLTGEISQQSIGYRSTNFGFFGQDNWKIRPNLSINYGLRWDFNTSPNEVSGRTANVTLGSGSSFIEEIANASVGLVESLTPDHSIAYFAPRLSFAWDPTKQGKLSIRGGIGVFYNRAPNILWSDAVRSNPPLVGSITADVRDPSGPQPNYGICQNSTTPFNCPLPPSSSLPIGVNERGGALTNDSFIGGVDQGLKQAYSINRFFGVQYAITPTWLLEADYTGSQSVHLYVRTDRNRCLGCYDQNGFAIRPNPFFGGISFGDNSAWSHYNGATFSVLHRFSNSFTFQAAYTIGKTIATVDAPGLGRDSLLSPVYNAYDINAQRSLASFDIPQAFTAHGLWELPTLKGQNSVLRAILGGWQLSGSLSLQAGYPYTVVDCGHSLDATECALPNAVGSVSHAGCDVSKFIAGCISASSFVDPCLIDTTNNVLSQTGDPNNFVPCVTQGNVGRNTFRGPGFANVDFSPTKNFHIPWFVGHEGARLQLRGSFFNFFNRTNLTFSHGFPGASNDLGIGTDGLSKNTNFGKADGAYSPRTIEVGLRLDF